MTPDQAAEVLTGHQYYEYTKNLGYYRSEYKCQCGADFWAGENDGDPTIPEAHAAHQAAVLAPLFAEAQAEAWDEGHKHYGTFFSPSFPEFGVNPYRLKLAEMDPEGRALVVRIHERKGQG